MTRILLDEVLREKLRQLKEPLELCDEAGRVLSPRKEKALRRCRRKAFSSASGGAGN